MLLKTENLKKYFLKKEIVKAVDGVDLFIKKNSIVALVGESGCGKSTLAKLILGFYRPTEGKIFFDNIEITDLKNEKVIRNNIQIVFQNPYNSLDPYKTIFTSMWEARSKVERLKKEEAKKLFKEYLAKVGIKEDILFRFPRQLSGGQIQRVCISRALLRNPRLLILDEPTSFLDVTTALKILDLLKELKEKFSLSYLFISHSLKLVKMIADYVFVMFKGKIVEAGPVREVFFKPFHPYTKLLLEAADYRLKKIIFSKREGDGCMFKERCPFRKDECRKPPPLKKVNDGHFYYCVL